MQKAVGECSKLTSDEEESQLPVPVPADRDDVIASSSSNIAPAEVSFQALTRESKTIPTCKMSFAMFSVIVD